ncbi:hypothetical protein CHARACLAT_002480, partial [Characodon lateralis]|nr:hypothetical protein [Characodon lateralis]
GPPPEVGRSILQCVCERVHTEREEGWTTHTVPLSLIHRFSTISAFCFILRESEAAFLTGVCS